MVPVDDHEYKDRAVFPASDYVTRFVPPPH